MIESFAHKGLEAFFLHGTTRGIQAQHAGRLARILDRLNAAASIQDMDAPSLALHPLKGELKGLWSVKVSGNWRLVFRFDEGKAFVVNYLDYH